MKHKAQPTNKHLIPKMQADGWTLDDMSTYFWALDDWDGVHEVEKIRRGFIDASVPTQPLDNYDADVRAFEDKCGINH